MTVTDEKVVPMFDQGKCLYLVKIQVQDDVLGKNKTCQSLLEEMEQTGIIVSTNFALAASSEVDAGWRPDVPVMILLFGSILKPADINILFEIPEGQILEFRSDRQLYHLDGRLAKSTGEPKAQPKKTSGKKQTPKAKVAPKAAPSTAKASTAAHKAAVKKPAAAKSAPSESTRKKPVEPQKPSADAASSKKPTKFEHETSLRVHVSLLDQLMTLAGELVLSRNQLLQSMSSNDQRGSEIAGQRIDLITSELQEAIMLTRMQSIGNVFNKFPRVVRDLAGALGKQVELTLEGKEVELDKTIIEAIGDPLTHLVRNAVDHGIETPDDRAQQGKEPQGNIYLKAYHEAGQVNIEITDDGQGLDGHKLANSAIEKGLISEEQAKLLSPREKINLIFLPGFSTAEQVTDVSGRGVGMDVVKT
ncbi:MAG: ATP-binding protein, partial [Desulfosarcinaceae bacterium]